MNPATWMKRIGDASSLSPEDGVSTSAMYVERSITYGVLNRTWISSTHVNSGGSLTGSTVTRIEDSAKAPRES